MGRGHRRGPKQLRFLTLLNRIDQAANQIDDSRQSAKVNYPLTCCYRSGFALFYVQDPSLLEFQRQFQKKIQSNNLRTVFGIDRIPSDTQLREVLDTHNYSPLLEVYSDYFSRLQRSKQLGRYQFYNNHYLVTLDGSEYFNSENIHCKLCLSKEKSNGHKEYHHQVLQAAMVHPDMRQVIPLAPEFIRIQDGSNKNDCETNAGKRAISKIRLDHPQLPIIIVGDSLFSTGPFIRDLQARRFSFFLGVKPGSHKTLFEDVEGLRRGKLLNRLVVVTKKKGQRYVYEWVNQVALNGTTDSPVLNYMELSIYNAEGKRTKHFSWVSDIEISKENIQHLLRGARARWKIENENFNTLKNHGYHLEHNFGHGRKYLSEVFLVLNILAFFMHQIFEIVDELYQEARSCCSSRLEYWNVVRASLRLLLFESWDQVLERIHAPPQPAFE